MEEVKVSVYCLAYNHEKYIRKALEGFVCQKTNFKYEVIVHDDSSTDHTAEIIKEYVEKYPEVIKAIFQTENQYSKGINIFTKYILPRIRGKYVAICEGDDYWIDPLKLQKQYDALETHPEVDMCSHAAYIHQDGKKIGVIAPQSADGIIPVEKVIMGGGEYVSTNSIIFRSTLLQKTPEFRKIYSIDYSLQIYGSLRGGLLYLNQYMSVYNFMTEGSWTKKNSKNNSSYINVCLKLIKMLEVLNEETAYLYKDIVSDKIQCYQYKVLWTQGDLDSIKSNAKIFNSLTLLQKLKLEIRIKMPKFYDWIRRMIKI